MIPEVKDLILQICKAQDRLDQIRESCQHQWCLTDANLKPYRTTAHYCCQFCAKTKEEIIERTEDT